jgi:hypothetical protein
LISHDAATKGVDANRRKALAHALELYTLMEELRTKGFATYEAIANELNRKGLRGSRGGKITRERLHEIRERLRKAKLV